MHPHSMEMAAAHHKFEFDRAAAVAQNRATIRRSREVAKRQMGPEEQSRVDAPRAGSRSVLALVFRFVAARFGHPPIQSPSQH